MRLCGPTSLLLLLSCAIQEVAAIFSDDAYSLDFHHALLGPPEEHTTFFHKPSTESKASLLYTLSDIGVLGAVNPKDGTVVWRQRLAKLEQDPSTYGLLKTTPGSDSVTSALDGKVQTWDAADGRLGWEWQSNGSVQAVELALYQGTTLAVVLSQGDGTNNFINCFNAEDGTPHWRFQDTTGDTPYSLISSAGRLFYLSLHAALLKGFKIKVTELDLSDGHQIGQSHLFGSESEVTKSGSVLFAGVAANLPIVIWADKSFKTVKMGSILHSQTTNLELQLAGGVTIQALKVHAPSEVNCNPHFLLHIEASESHSANVYHIDASTGRTSRGHSLPSIKGKGAFATSSQQVDVYFIRYSSSEISLTSSAASENLQTWSRGEATETEPRAIAHVKGEVISRGSSRFAIRSALAFDSGDWEMVRNGEKLWVKKEGLVGVVAAAFVDAIGDDNLAEKLAVEGQSSVLSAYIHRVQRHLHDLRSLPSWIEFQFRHVIAIVSGQDSSSQPTEGYKDKFGLSRYIIVATKRGKVAALDTGKNGRVAWMTTAVSLERGAAWDVLNIDIEADVIRIRTQRGVFIRVETHTGKIILDQKESVLKDDRRAISEVYASHYTDPTAITVDRSFNQGTNTAFQNGIVVVNRDSRSSLTGWTLHGNQKGSLAWEFRSLPGYSISHIVHRPLHDPVASIGKVLGDRNVLYKYLNPNLLLVTCESRVASAVAFFLLDSISGNVLHSTTHSGVDLDRPISSTISENWFLYTLYSRTQPKENLEAEPQELVGYQLSISELYESSFPNDRGPLSHASNFSARDPRYTGGDDEWSSPYVVSQTFLVPEPISQLSFTKTLQGITPRSLLCVTSRSHGIVSIPRYILDPRRPVGRESTSSEVEEGLFRYNAVLEFDSKWYLNHKRESLGFSKVIASPSLLESTSLVFAFGEVDLFGTNVSPIGGFDILGKGFSKFQLVATVAALAIGTGILAPLVWSRCGSLIPLFSG